MQRRIFAAIAALSTLLLLPGCASTGSMGEAEKLAAYQAAAGEPVNSFQYFGRISGWTSLDDRNIAVWTRPREAWLLTFDGICQDIDFAPVISVTNQANRVYAGFDKVIVHHNSPVNLPCRIRQIRPLDTSTIKAAEKAARDEPQGASSGT